MQYKVKISSPGFTKGDIIKSNENIKILLFDVPIDPNLYPDIFEKIPEPIFTTYDGVNIFEENAILHQVSIDCGYTYEGLFCIGEGKCFNKTNFHYFSTHDAAIKWIEENKPSYSKNQIKNALNKWYEHDYNGNYIKTNIYKEFDIPNYGRNKSIGE